MGDFDQHFTAGVASYFALIPIVFISVMVTPELPLSMAFFTLGSAPLVVMGSLFPDIDHHASKPHRVFKKYTSILFSILVFFAIYFNLGPLHTVLLGVLPPKNLKFFIGISALLASVVGYLGMKKAITVLRPKHRGVTHRFLTGLFVSVLIGMLVYIIGSVELGHAVVVLSCSSAMGTGFFTGFLSHLYVDGILFERKTYTTIR
jgi:hypothetical protein